MTPVELCKWINLRFYFMPMEKRRELQNKHMRSLEIVGLWREDLITPRMQAALGLRLLKESIEKELKGDKG